VLPGIRKNLQKLWPIVACQEREAVS